MNNTAAGASPVDCHVRPLIERLRTFAALDGGDISDVEEAADSLERLLDELTLCGELKRNYQEQHATARQALHEIAEEWAGAECGEPVHAQEAYAIGLAKRMYALAAAALRPN